jgi:hypothetical protein
MKDWKEWVLAFLATSWVVSAAPSAWERLVPVAEAALRRVIDGQILRISGSGPHQFGTSGVSEPAIKLHTLDPAAFSLNVTGAVNGSTRNNVFHMAYNRSQDGSQEVAGEPSLSLAIQSRFPMNGQDYMGYTIDYTSTDGTMNRRFLQLDVNRLTNAGRWSFDGEEIRFAPQVPLRLNTLDSARFSLYVSSIVNENVRDNVLYIGYNRQGPGVRELLSEPALNLQIESRYRTNGRELMEYNLDYTSADGAVNRRFLMFVVDRSTHVGFWSMAANAIALESDSNEQQFVFWPQGSRRTIITNGGQGNEVLQIGYDGGPLAPTAIQIGPSALGNAEFEVRNRNLLQPNELAVSLFGNYGVPGSKQVRVGPRDSGGGGLRVLVVPND